MSRPQTFHLKKVRKALANAGISMVAFARNAGVSRVHVYKVLAGERRAGPVLAARIETLVRDYAA